MKIVALLTGRGQNTFKDKNIKKIFNKPVLYYPCIEAKKSKYINSFFVSSENKKILSAASKYGYKKIIRPNSLSKPNSKHIDVLKHALSVLSDMKIKPDILVVLLANAPIIKKKWIDDCILTLQKNKKITSIVPVIKNNDNHPLRAKKIVKGYLRSHINNNSSPSNRQELENNYFLCHNFWVINTKEIYKNNGDNPWSFMGKKVKSYQINKSIDIHSREDLEIAKLFMKKYK
jgi:CMP-N,N'-diacetyllegionaminic acid synthase